jgi:hypothetical protein
MTKRTLAAICIPVIVSIPACRGGLTRDEAKNVIEQHRLIRPTDKVSVDAISSGDTTEAIVRATIAGTTTNLKFRRFDTGWTWEFVETKSGGWIAPDVAIGQIREEQRTVAAAAWAEQNKAAYASTAQTMQYVALYHVPNPSEVENYALWMRLKRSMAESFKSRPDMQDRLPVITSDRWTDAWGGEIRADFDSKDNSTLITSPGADKTRGTDDDLMCLNTFQRGVEDGRLIWVHNKSWRVPEDLGSVVGTLFDKRTDKLEYSKVVKP